MKLNCIIIEDDLIQRAINSKLVENHPNLHLMDAFKSGLTARKYLLDHAVDLIFLDVEMPDLGGFDFLDSIKTKPQVIFISSKAEYAVKAFKYCATDYIQKPISVERFNVAIQRALNFQALQNRTEINNKEHGEFIIIKSNLKKLKLYTDKIKWIEAYGDYVRVISEKGNTLVLSSMKSFETMLTKNKFIRVHKSYIINIEKIKKLNSKFAEIGETRIPISRKKKRNLANAIATA